MGDPNNPNAWVGIESIFWWSKSQPLSVPLVTTGPASQGAAAGMLGVAGTVSLDRPLDFGSQGGLRLYGGGWFDPNHTLGMDASMLFLGQQRAGYSVYDRSGAGNFVINEPVAGAPFITQLSAPGLATGGSTVEATSEFWGFDVNMLYGAIHSDRLTVNLLGGFSYLQLDERLTIAGNSTLLSTLTFTDEVGNPLVDATPGSTVSVFDRFTTRNTFYGGQIGAQVRYGFDRFFVNVVGKLAAGGVQEVVTVRGSSQVFPVNADPISYSGGNYATLQTGRYTSNHFAWSPQLQLSLGYQFTPFIRGTIGYNFLYLSQVVRPGNQIDNAFDGVTRPFVPMNNSAYWTQGINIGIQFGF